MAVTSIHPIKATISYTIDYIINPEKTEDKLYVTGFNCMPETAAIEFKMVRNEAGKNGTNQGWHLIQSFAPNEIKDIELAHKIGIELAHKTFGDKYSFVISTHIDKNHIHNHIVFNSVDNEEYRHYKSDYKTLYDIRNKSDKLCKDNGLSVIANPKKSFGKKDFNKNQAEKNGFKITNKMMAEDIKESANSAKDIDQFFSILRSKGYSIKETPKNVTLQKKGMERGRRLNTLSKSINEDLSIETIKGNIEKGIKFKLNIESVPENSIEDETRIDKPDRIKNNLEIQLNSHYSELSYEDKKALLVNLTQTINYINKNDIKDISDIDERRKFLSVEESSTRKILQLLEDKTDKLTAVYLTAVRYKKISDNLKCKINNSKMSLELRNEIESDKKVLRKLKNEIEESGVTSLTEALSFDKDIKELKYARIEMVNKYKSVKEDKENINIVSHNISVIMGDEKEKEKSNNQNKTRENIL